MNEILVRRFVVEVGVCDSSILKYCAVCFVLQVERLLMKFEEIPNRDKLKVNVFLIEIENVGGWILKFRKSGVIVNNR